MQVIISNNNLADIRLYKQQQKICLSTKVCDVVSEISEITEHKKITTFNYRHLMTLS
jgi:hypothetical protein